MDERRSWNLTAKERKAADHILKTAKANNGVYTESLRQTAEKLGMSRKTVQRAVDKLKRDNLAVVEGRGLACRLRVADDAKLPPSFKPAKKARRPRRRSSGAETRR